MMNGEEPKIKRSKNSILSHHLEDDKFQELFKKYWSNDFNDIKMDMDNLEVISKPFKVCKIRNFIKDEDFLDELRSELSDVHSKRFMIDLYQFEQSSDLINYGSEKISILYETFKRDMVDWMKSNTNIDLNGTISMTESCYCDTDYLLCHDDNMSDRKIAFVLYIMKNWQIEDGGSLDLFDTDSNGLPNNIIHSIYPEYNSLIFFEVSNHSYHQVAEITSPNKSRWSINGWFHGPKNNNNINLPPKPEKFIKHLWYDPIIIHENNDDINILNDWIMDSYLCAGIVKSINDDIEKESYTYLGNFLKQNVYKELSDELTSDKIIWKKVGPPNLRRYEVADETSLPVYLHKFYNLFKSINFFKLLKQYTQLDLIPNGKCMKPKVTIELQRWTKSCYTLICDKSEEENGITDVGEVSERENDDDNDEIEEENGQDDDDDKLPEQKLSNLSSNSGKTSSDNWINTSNQEDASCSKSEDYYSRRPPLHPDSEDSQVSDIGDYLSDSSTDNQQDQNDLDNNDEVDDYDDDFNNDIGYLDVIMQFHTSKIPNNETIDYVDPRELDSALIHIKPEDNHLGLIYYKIHSTCRFQKYINHYCDGYFYNLICTYCE